MTELAPLDRALEGALERLAWLLFGFDAKGEFMKPLSDEHALIISSDGHASAEMEDYRPFLSSEWREEFDEFCLVYNDVKESSPYAHQRSLLNRLDPDVVEAWVTDIVEPGRIRGVSDPKARIAEQDFQGLSAEVLFPDFGLPFELYNPFTVAALGLKHRTPQQVDAANQAYNRWLADFCQTAPTRFAGQALLSFDNVEAACREIRWAKDAGLKGIILPMFDAGRPLFDPSFEPIWHLAVELEMPVNSHVAISAVVREYPRIPPLPHPSLARALYGPPLAFFCHQLLAHFIWGGVLERHPQLQLVLTEQGSGWVTGALQSMDYSYEHSFLRRDVREIVKLKPSEYFARQCHLGSSIFSKAEIEARHQIGLDKMSLGMDYPHHEGTWGAGPGTVAYLRATLGAVGVPKADARQLMGGNAAKLWKFDTKALQPVVDTIGPSLDLILTPPEHDWFPRGDVNKPLGVAF